MLHDSHRCVQDDVRASPVPVHSETNTEEEHETEPDSRDGEQQADQISDCGAIEDRRHAVA